MVVKGLIEPSCAAFYSQAYLEIQILFSLLSTDKYCNCEQLNAESLIPKLTYLLRNCLNLRSIKSLYIAKLTLKSRNMLNKSFVENLNNSEASIMKFDALPNEILYRPIYLMRLSL